MMLTNFLPNQGNGAYTLYATATELEGNTVTVGSKTITGDNAHAVKPFGAIDTPAQGGTISGMNYSNFGWVLTPLPNTIPKDGSTITVWVDGAALGHPVYNQYRWDIAAYFPGLNNSNGAVGYYTLDTTAFENGIHSIYWTATDNGGNSDGIGSRYVNVLNPDSNQPAEESNVPLPADAFTGLISIIETHPIYIKKGFTQGTIPKPVYPGENGVIMVKTRVLERVEIHLLEGKPLEAISGFMKVGDELRPLPIGSTLDVRQGIFHWLPGPGFLGEYRLVFYIKNHEGSMRERNIVIRVVPAF
jgi:hypothetical protein